jgi:hypothetical protein
VNAPYDYESEPGHDTATRLAAWFAVAVYCIAAWCAIGVLGVYVWKQIAG